ncbi:hypothetical protein MHU86_1358 [Fragilaria crotonensis]|nr:hypothetical protein MHU86_1358 [Fragilaria crotonensis]
MDYTALSYILFGNDGIAKEISDFQFMSKDHQNDALSSHLTRPNHPSQPKRTPKTTGMEIHTPQSSLSDEGEFDDGEEFGDVDLVERRVKENEEERKHKGTLTKGSNFRNDGSTGESTPSNEPRMILHCLPTSMFALLTSIVSFYCHASHPNKL